MERKIVKPVKWIVSEVFFPDEVSTALIMTEIAEEYAKKSKIGVICGPGGYEKTYQPGQRMLDDNIKIYRVNVADFNKNQLLSRVFRLLILTVKLTVSILRNVKKNDELLIVTNPAFLLVALAVVKPFKKFRLNILVHDVFPENLVPAGLAKKDSLKYKVLNRLFNWAYKRADRLIALGDDMAELLVDKVKISKKLITVIPNWSDPNIHPLPQAKASEYFNLDIDGKIVISFAGNVGRVQGLVEFIEAFIEANNKDLVLIVIGDGAMRDTVESDLLARNVHNVHFVGPRPRSEQNQFLNACDISLVTLKEGMFGLGVPSKTYNIMAAGKPVLYVGDANSEIDRYVTNFDIGWSFNWGDKNELVRFLSNLHTGSFHLIQEKGDHAFNTAERYFKKETVVKMFNQI